MRKSNRRSLPSRILMWLVPGVLLDLNKLEKYEALGTPEQIEKALDQASDIISTYRIFGSPAEVRKIFDVIVDEIRFSQVQCYVLFDGQLRSVLDQYRFKRPIPPAGLFKPRAPCDLHVEKLQSKTSDADLWLHENMVIQGLRKVAYQDKHDKDDGPIGIGSSMKEDRDDGEDQGPCHS